MNGDIIRVINEDCTGRKIMRKTANAEDSEAVRELFNSVIDKYGLDLQVVSVKTKRIRKEEEFHW